MRIRLAVVLLVAVAALAVPPSAFAGAQPHMDQLYADLLRLGDVRVGNSLKSQLDAAQASIDRNQFNAAIHQLQAFGHELNGRFIGNPNLIGNPDFAPIIRDLAVVIADLQPRR